MIHRWLAAGVGLLAACSQAAPPPPPPAPPAARDPIDECLDKVTQAAGLNSFGDPQGTNYTGGTPLFDEATGHSTSRLEYVNRRHPELAAKCPRTH